MFSGRNVNMTKQKRRVQSVTARPASIQGVVSGVTSQLFIVQPCSAVWMNRPKIYLRTKH